MTSKDKTPHILIVGAGLGGLTLAQCLRKQGISFEIFERDADDESRPQGWAIGLHTMLDELQASVPSDLPDLRKATHHLSPLKLNTQLCFYSHSAENRLGVQDSPETPCLRANRPKLRQWLATNIPIQWNKRLTRIEQGPGKRVTVSFGDDSKAVGDVVVGADGVHSFVREHLLQLPNDDALNTVPTATIIGEITLSGAAMERQLSLGHSCWVFVAPDFSFTLFIGLQQVSPDGNSGDYYWFYMETDESVGQPDHWLLTASREEKLAYVKKAVGPLDFRFREIFEATPVSGIKDIPFIYRDAEITKLPSGSIAILGDAAHPMTPFRGEGGFHAIKDALLLSKVLGQMDSFDAPTLHKAIDMYHAEIIERGVKAVKNSRAAHTSSNRKLVGWGHTAVPLPQETISLSSLM